MLIPETSIKYGETSKLLHTGKKGGWMGILYDMFVEEVYSPEWGCGGEI